MKKIYVEKTCLNEQGTKIFTSLQQCKNEVDKNGWNLVMEKKDAIRIGRYINRPIRVSYY